MLGDATQSEFQLFRTLSNPDRTDFQQQKPSSPAAAPVLFSAPPPVATPSPPRTPPASVASKHSKKKKKKKKRKRDSDEGNDDDGGSSKRSNFSQSKEGQAEKFQFLINLKRLRQQGCVLTREYSTQDSLEDIKYEFERQKMNLDTVNGTALLKDGLKLGVSGIEMLNNKLGPFLRLQGWSESVTNDMSRFDNVLTRIYLKYLNRTSSMNPIVELGFVLAGSMLMFHFQQSVFGPKPGPMAGGDTFAPPTSIPIDRNVDPPPSTTRRPRPTMRRPNSQPRDTNVGSNSMFANLSAPTFPPTAPAEDSVPEIRQIDEERGPRTVNVTDVERVEDEEREAPPPVPETPFREEQIQMEDVSGGLDFLE